tara:strand:+ start:4377 stop:4964 length:588 start_codon:yes stop_codon:yes gene_type:complete
MTAVAAICLTLQIESISVTLLVATMRSQKQGDYIQGRRSMGVTTAPTRATQDKGCLHIMKFATGLLDKIYGATSGKCHICHKELTRNSYAKTWEVDHSKAKANGGSNHLNNLRAACLSCNRSKGARLTSKQARADRGKSRAPLSGVRRREVLVTRAGLTGVGVFAAARALGLFGPIGIAISFGAAALSLAFDPDD